MDPEVTNTEVTPETTPQVPETTPQAPEVPESTPQLTPQEEAAYAQGWRPKEEFSGNPEDWRPAREWVERGEFISKIKRLSHEVDEMKNGYKNLYQAHIKSVREARVQAIQELRAARQAAHEEGDLNKVESINDRINQIKEEAKQEVQQSQAAAQQAKSGAGNEHFEQWLQRNPWYADPKEKKMKRYADAIVLEIIEEEGAQPPEVLGQRVEAAVREQFPDKFRRPQGPASPDAGGATRGPVAQKSSKYADIERSLSPEERSIMDTYVNRLKMMTKEEFLRDYSNARS